MKYCENCMVINFFRGKRKGFKITVNIPDTAKFGKFPGILYIIDNKKYLISIKIEEIRDDKNE